MVGNSKVLTVSYGTFSCTLEGFDDSFDTMKAIAEYFRDLAAEDRYFGAEPPQPDADVLARIAERELARGVKARTDGKAVLLQPAVAPAPAEEAPVAEEMAEEVSETTSEALATEPAYDAEPVAEKASDESAEMDDDVSEMAEAEAELEDTQEVVEEFDDPVDEVEEFEADEMPAESFEHEAEQSDDQAAAETADEVEEEDVIEAEEVVAETEYDTAEEEFEAEEIEEEPAPTSAASSLAAKLRRIQAVVGANSKPNGARNSYMEDEHAEDFSDGAEETAAQETEYEDNAEEAAPEAAMDEQDSDFAAEEEAMRPRVLKMKRADFEAAMAKSAAEEAAEYDDDGADDDGMDSIFAENDSDDLDDAGQMESSLSAEDEADLMAELADAQAEAEVENTADLSTVVAGIVGAQEDDALAEGPSDQQATSEDADEGADAFRDSDATMSRLMDEAAAKLDDPEGRNRRDAYSHLKAAVAAKQAARSMGEDEDANAEDREDSYRKDLADVVRPRRAAARENAERTRRPSPAPLKLVASQRVDGGAPDQQEAEAEATSQAAVRPRRVAASAAGEASVDDNVNTSAFASFAQNAGASELQDMMEAAAAYLTHVEGLETFTRPKLMRTVQHAMPDGSFSREDGLRAFGTLLRQNRINKIRGGSFEVTQETRFQPEAREIREAR